MLDMIQQADDGIIFNALFIFLFVFRYLRLVVHLFSFWYLYRPARVLHEKERFYAPKQCAVILPTIDPGNTWFEECLTSVSENGPGAILIVTVGRKLRLEVETLLEYYRNRYPEIHFRAVTGKVANKRLQVAQAIPLVPDLCPIIALVDDHVVWRSTNFLPTAMAPFEDLHVGLVGTNKRVRRLDHGKGLRGFWHGFWNFLGCLYLERHNFEIKATNAIDGGVFVVSGRTSLHRTLILQDPNFLRSFTNEKVLGFGPIAADDDNHIYRWNVSHGWNVKIQYCEDAMVETMVGEYPKFLSQCLRWTRTTWRSNSCSLFTDRTVWHRQPWCVYAVYITSFFNFALVNDALLLWLIGQTSFGSEHASATAYMACWIFATKLVKPFSYFLRHPKDLMYLPGMLLFGWCHSFIKLWALLTFGSNAWSGRNLNAIDTSDTGDDFDDDDRFKPDTAGQDGLDLLGDDEIIDVPRLSREEINAIHFFEDRPLHGY